MPSSLPYHVSYSWKVILTDVSPSRFTGPYISKVPGFPSGLVVKNPPANAGDVGSIPGLGRFPWRRNWQPIPVFLPGKSHGQRSLADYSPCGRKRARHDLATKQQQIQVKHRQENKVKHWLGRQDGWCSVLHGRHMH